MGGIEKSDGAVDGSSSGDGDDSYEPRAQNHNHADDRIDAMAAGVANQARLSQVPIHGIGRKRHGDSPSASEGVVSTALTVTDGVVKKTTSPPPTQRRYSVDGEFALSIMHSQKSAEIAKAAAEAEDAAAATAELASASSSPRGESYARKIDRKMAENDAQTNGDKRASNANGDSDKKPPLFTRKNNAPSSRTSISNVIDGQAELARTRKFDRRSSFGELFDKPNLTIVVVQLFDDACRTMEMSLCFGTKLEGEGGGCDFSFAILQKESNSILRYHFHFRGSS